MFLKIMFLLSAMMTVGGAFLTATSRNLMHACIYLLACLFGVAGLYATLGADFLAATQLVVYAGGVVILMLFAVMLTGGIKEFTNKFGLEKVPSMGSTKTYVIAGFTITIFSYVLMKVLAPVLKIKVNTELPAFSSTVESIGEILVTNHILAFEISSILLLGALVGAAVISRPREKR
jgi:NADH:ubiquinone oxidoreductase subunit 6 (subunit J)